MTTKLSKALGTLAVTLNSLSITLMQGYADLASQADSSHELNDYKLNLHT